ncbi:MAG: hypothetical protein QXU54_01790 [Candidatus Micrarchaeia archaeon]
MLKGISRQAQVSGDNSQLKLSAPEEQVQRRFRLPPGVYKIMLGLALACTVAGASAQEMPAQQGPQKCSTSEVQFEGVQKKVKIGTDYELERAYAQYKKGKLSYEDLRAVYVTPKSAEIIRKNGLPPKLLPKVSDEILAQLECDYQYNLKNPKPKQKSAPVAKGKAPSATEGKDAQKAKPAAEHQKRNYTPIYYQMADGTIATEQRFVEPPGKMVIHKLPKPPKVQETTVYAMSNEEYAQMRKGLSGAPEEKTIAEIIEEKRVPEEQLKAALEADAQKASTEPAAVEYKTECKGCVAELPNKERVEQILAEKEKAGDNLAVIAKSIEGLEASTRNGISELDFALEEILRGDLVSVEGPKLLERVEKLHKQMIEEVQQIQKQLDDYNKSSEGDRMVITYMLDQLSQLDVYVIQKKEEYSSLINEKIADENAPTSKEVFELVDSFEAAQNNEINAVNEQINQLVAQYSRGKGKSEKIVIDAFGEEPNTKEGFLQMGNKIIERFNEKVTLAGNDGAKILEKIDECRRCTDPEALRDKVIDTVGRLESKRDEIADILIAHAETEAVPVAAPDPAREDTQKEAVKGALEVGGIGYLSQSSIGSKQLFGWDATAPVYIHINPAKIGFTLGGAYKGYGHEYTEGYYNHNALLSVGPSLLLEDKDGRDWRIAALLNLSKSTRKSENAMVGGTFLVTSDVMNFNVSGTFTERAPLSYSLNVWDTASKYPLIVRSAGIYSQKKDGNSVFECTEGSVLLQLPLWYDKPAYLNLVVGAGGRYASASPNMAWNASAVVGASLTWKYLNFGGGAILGSEYSQLFVPGIGTYERDGATYMGSISSSQGFESGYLLFGSVKAVNMKDVFTLRLGAEYRSVGNNWALVPELGILIVW